MSSLSSRTVVMFLSADDFTLLLFVTGELANRLTAIYQSLWTRAGSHRDSDAVQPGSDNNSCPRPVTSSLSSSGLVCPLRVPSVSYLCDFCPLCPAAAQSFPPLAGWLASLLATQLSRCGVARTEANPSGVDGPERGCAMASVRVAVRVRPMNRR